jgi:hypothetical protein
MSDIDYDLLSGSAGGDPPEGWKGPAKLIRAARAGNPTALVTEWSSAGGDPPYYWTTWFGFSATRIAVTQELLDALGVDRAKIVAGRSQEERDEALDSELYFAVDKVYDVRVDHWAKGVNTYVDGRSIEPRAIAAPPAQTTLGDEIPVDGEDLPPVEVGVGATAASEPDDDDIPF